MKEIIHVRVEKELKDKLNELAKEKNLTLSDVVRLAIINKEKY